MARQVLVRPGNGNKNGDSFTSLKVQASEPFNIVKLEVAMVEFKVKLDTIHPDDMRAVKAVWSVPMKLAKLGVVLLGTEWKDGVLTALFTAATQSLKIEKNVIVLDGMMVEPVVMRVTNHSTILDLNRPETLEL